MIPEVLTLMKLIFVSPATNAVNERSFSSLKRLKIACRSTRSDLRLNNVDIANEFIDPSEYRKFRKFVLQMQLMSTKVYKI